MNREEFLERLEKLLWNISDSEREEALQYYHDYFDDAGAENEEAVIADLGSPEQVAQKIKAGLSEGASEYTEQGYQDTRFRNNQEVISRGQTDSAASSGSKKAFADRNGNFWKILAIVLLCILAVPAVAPVCAVILAVIFAVVVGIGGVCIGIVAAGFVVLLAGLIVIGVGIAQLFVSPAVGITMSGVGCLIFALGILLAVITVWCCVKILPGLIRGIVGLLSYPFRKAGAKI